MIVGGGRKDCPGNQWFLEGGSESNMGKMGLSIGGHQGRGGGVRASWIWGS